MGQVKFKTDQRHRFNKQVQIGESLYNINSKGEVDINEEDVNQALLAGYTTSENISKLTTSADVSMQSNDVKMIIETAKAQAKAIVDEATLEAEKIINEAKVKAGDIVENSVELEKKKFKKELEVMSVDDLKNYLITSKVATKEYKHIDSKEDLIDFIVKKAFPEV